MLDCFRLFKASTAGYTLPDKFTFPFCYDPHPLSELAAQELQQHLEQEADWAHNFGLDPAQEGMVIGKMFGVMVVQTPDGNLGYLAAFSGKVAGGNHHKGFVPPVYDILAEDGFFVKGERILNRINKEVAALEALPALAVAKERFASEKERIEALIQAEKQALKTAKKDRKKRREAARNTVPEADFIALQEVLKEESLKQQYFAKQSLNALQEELATATQKLAVYTDRIAALKQERKQLSASLQQQIFEHYCFLNKEGKERSLGDIFKHTVYKVPPAGAGECAAPKLLQYAYLHNLQPIAMAEFWWGQSPKSEIRQHKQYYPACKGKCDPILSHMLIGLSVDDNPMLTNPAIGKEIEIVYEDEAIIVVNKPAEFLSVPGRVIFDSVQKRLAEKYPDATGPLLVHRLDMSTSGILLAAKTKEYHKYIQYQFINRLVEKRYVALLDGVINEDAGVIELPLAGDFIDRPRQLVCYDTGKYAKTTWERIAIEGERTRVYFYPHTGRTHQLRVHAAHTEGLAAPIVGDDLYGKKEERLHLHAQRIKFKHPITEEEVVFEVAAGF